jgi:hypothetical protein
MRVFLYRKEFWLFRRVMLEICQGVQEATGYLNRHSQSFVTQQQTAVGDAKSVPGCCLVNAL